MSRVSLGVKDSRLFCPDCGTSRTGHHHWYPVFLKNFTLVGMSKVTVTREVRRCNNPACSRKTFVVAALDDPGLAGSRYTARARRYCVEKVTRTGLSYNRAVEEVERETGMRLSISVLYHWVKLESSSVQGAKKKTMS